MGGIHQCGDYFSFVPNGFKPQPRLIKRCLFIPQKRSSKEKARFLKLNFKLNQNGGQ